jgi:flavin-dependent dehydrogenase
MNPLAHNPRRQSGQANSIVIGASIAGLQTALLLAQGGGEVQLFDANDPTQVKPRTLIATAQLAEALGFLPSEAVINRVGTIEIFSSNRSVKINLPQPDLIVERAKIIPLLTERAAKAGVKIFSGHKFLGFEPDGDGVFVRIQRKQDQKVREFYTRRLIGADGASSRVAHAAQINGLARVPLLQAIVDLPDGYDAGNVRVWFEPDDTPYFYWLIPESAGKAAIGFIAEESHTAKKKLARFLRAHGFRAGEIQAAWIPLSTPAHKPWRKISGCDIFLVGDAAGHVKVTTVGGLVTGLWGARAAAQSILKKVSYEKTLRSLRRELFLHEMIRRVLNRFHAHDYDQLVQAIDRSTARILGRHNRDELTVMALKLIMTKPRLLAFLPRLFARGKIAESLPKPDAIQQATPST